MNILPSYLLFPRQLKIPASPPASDFPTDVLKSMKFNNENSAKLSLKLMQICKYFVHKKFSYLDIYDVHVKENYLIYKTDERKSNCIKWEDLNKIPNFLCLTKTINIYCDQFFALFLSKIVSWEIKELRILMDKELTFKEFKMLIDSRKLKTVYFGGKIVIKNDDGEILSFEETLKHFSNLVKIELHPVSPIVSTDQFKALRFPKLKWLGIHNFNETFDFKTLKNFMLSHQNIEFEIHSWHKFSEEYTRNVQFHVDAIIKHWYSYDTPLHISFPGQTQESEKLLKEHRESSRRYNSSQF